MKPVAVTLRVTNCDSPTVMPTALREIRAGSTTRHGAVRVVDLARDPRTFVEEGNSAEFHDNEECLTALWKTQRVAAESQLVTRRVTATV